MLSERAYRAITLYFTWTNFTHIYPFVYNSTTHTFTLSEKLYKWKIIYFALLSQALFVNGRILYDYCYKDGSTEDFIFRMFFMTSIVLACNNQMTVYYRAKELVAALNAFQEFDRRCADLYKDETKKKNRDVVGFLIGVLFPQVILNHHVLFIGLYFYNPKSPNYFNSLLPFDKYSWISIVMVLPEIAGHIVAWTSCYLSLMYCISFQMNITYWLKQIGLSKSDESKPTIEGIRQPETALSLYREIQILTRMYNNSMRDIYQPLHALVVNWTFVTCAFSSVRFYDRMHWFPYSFSPTSVLTVALYHSATLPTSAGILIHSAKFKTSWREELSQFSFNTFAFRKRYLAFIRSCPELQIHIGDLFFLDRTTLIVTLNILINQTISLLLSVP